ncbi:hypothetical protein CY34DRAFT_805929, partial [Suillus luteus UH-Slu-Lm8-n1]
MISPVLTIGQEIELIWVTESRQEKQENTTNSRQRQRWSLMTVLYLVVHISCYAIAWLAVVLTPKCSRYAISECLILLPLFS